VPTAAAPATAEQAALAALVVFLLDADTRGAEQRLERVGIDTVVAFRAEDGSRGGVDGCGLVSVEGKDFRGGGAG
jgi:hypothetical protein